MAVEKCRLKKREREEVEKRSEVTKFGKTISDFFLNPFFSFECIEKCLFFSFFPGATTATGKKLNSKGCDM